MKKSKEQLIEEFLKTPIQVGENISDKDVLKSMNNYC